MRPGMLILLGMTLDVGNATVASGNTAVARAVLNVATPTGHTTVENVFECVDHALLGTVVSKAVCYVWLIVKLARQRLFEVSPRRAHDAALLAPCPPRPGSMIRKYFRASVVIIIFYALRSSSRGLSSSYEPFGTLASQAASDA